VLWFPQALRQLQTKLELMKKRYFLSYFLLALGFIVAPVQAQTYPDNAFNRRYGFGHVGGDWHYVAADA
jgi:hypothetical protein